MPTLPDEGGPMIVVAGGSGVLGRLVVAELTANGQQVRVLVRDAHRAAALFGPDVDVVAVDVRKADGLGSAMAGANVVVSAVHGLLGGRGAGPTEVDQQGNAHLAAAAQENGADIVLVSVLGAAPDSPLELFRAKHAAEQLVQSSAAAWTVVRAGAFLETWVGILRQTAGRSGRPLVFGRGAQPITFVSAADVAAVVCRAAVDPTLRGSILSVGGERLTLTELSAAVQAADGRASAPRHLPRALLRAVAVAARPISPAVARQNQTALAMDTQDLGDGDAGLRTRLGLPSARTSADVLQQTSA